VSIKKNHKQINPHMPKVECDQLVKDDVIFGCGKPFELIPLTELKQNENPSIDASYNVVKCEYI
jgi:hypothetical protein